LAGNECCYTTNVKATDGLSTVVMSKSQSELMLKALEQLLKENPCFENFFQPFCFPSDGSRVKGIQMKAKKLEAMYDLEVYISAELRLHQVEVNLEGIYAPSVTKYFRHKCDIVASKVCLALIESGLFDVDILKEKFERNPTFTLNPDLILDRMDQAQRLKVIEQTGACLAFIRCYFRL